MQFVQNALLWISRKARRMFVFVVGITVLILGIAMIVLPGPAVIVIPIGLAILATEFVWARRWLEYSHRKIKSLRSLQRNKKTNSKEDRTNIPSIK